jgi:two-component system sensor histidine kinase KdpD
MLSVRERRLSLLYSLSQALSIKQNLHDIIHTSLEYATKYFDAHVMIFLRNGPESIEPEPRSLHEVAVDEKERGVAQWCFVNRTPCGKYTDVLHMARFHYIPLLAPDSAAGVLGVCLEEGRTWMPDQEDSLQMLGRTLALSLEREWLAEENRRNLTARESERLSRILLNTVSHELRTPLTAIKGSVTALMDASAGADPETRDILLSETLTATDRLNGIVENLLAMSRLESGVLRLKRSDVDVVDMTSVVADAFRRHGQDHPLTVRVEEELPPISVDLVLMVQVLANLVGNAVNHTPPGTPIELAAAQSEREIHLTVADSGPGVSSEELPRLFDPFFRGKRALGGGVGLGLSICRGIVEAHGGKISASINERGGITVLVALPEVAP